MATDKKIQSLTPAETPLSGMELFVLEQSGDARKIDASAFVSFLADAYDGHGGISSIEYLSSNVLVDTYRITYTNGDTSTFDVTNGKGISSIAKTGTSGLVDTYTISYNDGSTTTFTVTNGADGADGADGDDGIGISSIEWTESGTSGDGQTHTGTITYTDGNTSEVEIRDGVKGDSGQNAYVWIKWADDYPTSDGDMSSSVGPYIGIYSGPSSTAPTDYTAYDWYQYKGDTGEAGATGDYIEPFILYGKSASASTEPSSWTEYPSALSPSGGDYIWTKTEYRLHATQSVQASKTAVIGYFGQDGAGAGSVTQITFNGTTFYDDGTGNVPMSVDAEDVGAIADPESKSSGQVLTWDSSAGTSGTGAWVAVTPSAGSVDTVNSVGPTSGTTNIQLYATDIPMSSSNNTTVANAIPSASSTVPPADNTNGAVGTGTTWARADHKHPLNVPTSGTPSDLGTAALGSATTYSRSDHVHKMPTASDVGALPSSTSIPTAATTAPGADVSGGSVGTGTKFARNDHKHELNVATSGTPAALGTASLGSSATYARTDHVHPMLTNTDVGVDFKIYDSVADIGLSTGTTITAIWDAMPDNSMLYTTAGQLATGQKPNNYGMLEIVKRLGDTTPRGKIEFHGTLLDNGKWEMFFNSSNKPDGTWLPERANNITGVTQNLLTNNDSANPYICPTDGYAVCFCTSGSIGNVLVCGAGQSSAYVQIGNEIGRYSVFVKAGMKLWYTGSPNTARFVGLS